MMNYDDPTPWYSVSKKLSNPRSCEEAIIQAGADWKVELRSLFITENTEGTVTIGERAPAKAVLRVNNDGTSQILSVVGLRYRTLQNTVAFNFFDDYVQSNYATLETAGILAEGRRVWILAKLTGGGAEIVPNDSVDMYLLLSNSHDGSSPVRLGFLPLRRLSQSTLSSVNSKALTKLLRIRHTGKIEDNLCHIRNAMNIVNARFEATVEQYRALTRRRVAKKDLEKYVEILFAQEDNGEKKDQPNQKRIEAITELFNSGKGNDLTGVEGTWWAAYNAVTEYLSWQNGRNTDSRLTSLWFGEGQKLNDKALVTASKLSYEG